MYVIQYNLTLTVTNEYYAAETLSPIVFFTFKSHLLQRTS